MGSSGRGWVANKPEDPEVGVGESGAKKAKLVEGAKIAFVGRRLRRYVVA
jgi:hypothetical protein